MSVFLDPPGNLHPYTCSGPGECVHCDRLEVGPNEAEREHDPATCALCDPAYDLMPNPHWKRNHRMSVRLTPEEVEECEAVAASKGLVFLLDHLGLDGLGNTVRDLHRAEGALAEAQTAFAYVATTLEGSVSKREHVAKHCRFQEHKLADIREAIGQPMKGNTE